jgi:NhaP-type Na+/H+ or K+/H+ antiporter
MAADGTAIAIGIAGSIIVLGLLINWFSRKIRISGALLLILLGILLGPVFGYFDPAQWGDAVSAIVTFALIVVLFDTGYKMKFSHIKDRLFTSSSIALLGVIFTVTIGGIIALLIFDLPWQLAILLGAIVASTDITVVAPLLENLKLPSRLSNTLNLEATFNSPVAAIIATTMAILITTGGVSEGVLAFVSKTFLFQIVIGIFLGAVLGYFFVGIFKHLKIGSRPQILSIGLILLVYAIAEMLGASGIFAVFVMGLVFGNSEFPLKTVIHEFESTISMLIVIFVFVLFGAFLQLNVLLAMGLGGLAFVIITFLSRAPAVIVHTRGRWLTEDRYLFLIGPRGMVCAVLALSYMTLFPEPNVVLSVVFGVMILTIIISSFAQYLVGKRKREAPSKKKGKFKRTGREILAAAKSPVKGATEELRKSLLGAAGEKPSEIKKEIKRLKKREKKQKSKKQKR